jgi:diguanylate cyclase (GGDEF)-like protein
MLVFSLSVQSTESSAPVINVGVYQNAPKIFYDQQGRADGFFIDLLKEIAASEDWALNYVPCEWRECLKKLEKSEIDLLPDVAYSEERARKLLFGREVVLSSWSVVYVRAEKELLSLNDLQGKTLAEVKDSIQYQAISEQARRLGIRIKFQEVDGFGDVFRLVKSGWVDAGLVNTYFGRRYAQKYQLKNTSILVRPSLLSFAAHKGKSEILDVIDTHLAEYKNDLQSVYFRLVRHWLISPAEKPLLPGWLIWLLLILSMAGLLAVAAAGTFHLLVRRRTAQLQQETIRLEHLANHDPLTGLPNRKLFFDRLKEHLEQARKQNTQLAVLYIDLDQFKQVNDSYGHAVGDGVLQEIAVRLEKQVNLADTIARLGGDEFAVVMKSLPSSDKILSCVQRLHAIFREPVIAEGQPFVLSASIGISLFPQDGLDAYMLLRNADTAMFKAKESGRGTFQFYVEEMTRNAVEQARLESHLRAAVEAHQMELHYQPKICLKTGALVGFEALIRWNHPQLGMMPPNDFIPLAEESGLILPIGEWVLRTACRQVTQWYREGLNVGVMAVNVAARQLQDYALLDVVKKALRETGCKSEWLEIELTESSIMTQTRQAVAVMNELCELGVKLAIDDFGTGYSSLAYLRQLPIDKLKIDKSFVANVAENVDDVAIVRAVTVLGKTLNLEVIAEGVETTEQEALLREEGCDVVQGYLYSRPLPAEAAKAFLKKYQ